MRQYLAAKRQHPDALLFFRLGDFYELFFDDAKTASRELQLTLTARDKERNIPMCGVPWHAAENYIARLLRQGYRVAICDQMEDPKLTKKIVRREVTRVLTPGTALDPIPRRRAKQLPRRRPPHRQRRRPRVSRPLHRRFPRHRIFRSRRHRPMLDELLRLSPSELIFPTTRGPFGPKTDCRDPRPASRPNQNSHPRRRLCLLAGLRHPPPRAPARQPLPRRLRPRQSSRRRHRRRRHRPLRPHHAADRSQSTSTPSASTPAPSASTSIRSPPAISNWSIRSSTDAGPDVTLFRTMDACCTPMGKRMLRASLLRPMIDPAAIESRYAAVDAARADLIRREELRRSLQGILDLDRLLARISLDSAGPRDVLALAASLKHLPAVRTSAETLCHPDRTAKRQRRGDACSFWNSANTNLDPLEDLCAAIFSTLVPEPPLTLAEGGVIATGIDAELDDLRSTGSSGRASIAAIEDRERRRTGIGSLKVRFNSVFGYYIEITKVEPLPAFPPTTNASRPSSTLSASPPPSSRTTKPKSSPPRSARVEIEKRIFADLRRRLVDNASRIRRTSAAVAEIDLVANFAHLAALRGYTRPRIDPAHHSRNRRRPPSRHRAPHGQRRRHPLRPQRSLSRCQRQHLFAQSSPHHRPQHGRQIHVPPPGRAPRHPRPDRQLRPRRPHDLRHRRPCLHPHRRQPTTSPADAPPSWSK